MATTPGVFKHPHDTLRVVDNTGLKTDSFLNSGATLITPFISDKGIDGQMTLFRDLAELLRSNGTANFKVHGQAYYNAIAWLKSGGQVRGMRITAKDATYANTLIMAKVAVFDKQKTDAKGNPLYIDSVTGQETTTASGNVPIKEKKAEVKIFAETYTSLKEVNDDIEILIKEKYDDSNAADGIIFPLYLFVSKGRGDYGNAYRFRLTPAPSRDKETVYRNYNFELLNNENGLSKVEVPLNVSTFPDARSEYSRSEYIEDVLKRNIYPIHTFAIEDSFYQIAEMLQPVVQQQHSDRQVAPEEIDFLFFRDRDTTNYKHITVAKDSLNLSLYEGYPLLSGDDGAFKRSNRERQIAINERYIDAFDGKIDRSILDRKRNPAHCALDANFPLEVKQAMINWRFQRDDLPLYLDAGLAQTILDLKTWRQSELTVNSYGVSLLAQNFMTPDEYTGKDIPVTMTYLVANTLPAHFASYGNHMPLAGDNVKLNQYIIPNSIRPTVVEDTDKSDLYEMRLNYLEDEYGDITFGTQMSSQSKDSQLLDMNNVHVLYDIKRDVEMLSPKFRYKPNETEEDLKEFNRMLDMRISKYRDFKCKFIEGTITKSANPLTPRRIETFIRVGFKSVTEINDITIQIDRA